MPAKRFTDEKTNEKRRFSLRAIHARRCANLTQDQAATKTLIHVQRIRDFEGMQAWPESAELDALAAVYEAEAAWLLGIPPYDL